MRKLVPLALAVTLLVGMLPETQSAVSSGPRIEVLSSRPDMVSGPDALIAISEGARAPAGKMVVRLNGKDVTSPLHADPATENLTGLVTGLVIGKNSLQVFAGKGSKPEVELTLTDFPVTGPIFSGPHETPFVCQTQDFKLPDGKALGPSLDKDCSVDTVVTYVYKSTEPVGANSAQVSENAAGAEPVRTSQIKPLIDAASLPSDVAWTTTSTGQKVPYVVRVETGTVNRAIYQFAVLDDPTQAGAHGPLAPHKAWNRRLLYTFGGGCTGGWYRQGTTVGNGGPFGMALINDAIVGKGYAEASATLNVFGNNCNDLLAAETMMMVKERYIKSMGVPDFTLSRGGSGGSYQQNQIADNYPGLLDGIIPSLTFPDVLELTQMLTDSQLLNRYYEKAGNALSPGQKLAIAGVGEIDNVISSDPQADRVKATGDCPAALDKPLRYDPVSNRSGARCDLFDHTVNVYGRDPSTGFARRPLDNTGVQYGLAALNDGAITATQFLDLNEGIGGYDNDGNLAAGRAVADPLALRAAYQTGRVTWGGNGLGKLPIIDVRPYRDLLPKGDGHLKYHSFSLRQRLLKANGTFANDVMILGPMEQFGKMEEYAIAEMDAWLTALKKDRSNGPPLQKILRAKPPDLTDACYTPNGERIVEPLEPNSGRCNALYKTFPSPHMVAGAPTGNNVLKCQLKAIDYGDYKVNFSDAEKARLAAIFPSGVCDWQKPGVEQQPERGIWLNFTNPSE